MGDIKQYKFLVVDDTYVFRISTDNLLVKHFKGCKVEVASNKEDALMYFDKLGNSADLLIIDITINANSQDTCTRNDFGITLMEEIRVKNNSVNIIAYTKWPEDKFYNKLKELNVHYVKKYTFSQDDQTLITKIIELLSNIP